MNTCYKCRSRIIETDTIKEGINLKCEECTKCGEQYFSVGEIIRFDTLTGRRKMQKIKGMTLNNL